jgi:hypothetical protein
MHGSLTDHPVRIREKRQDCYGVDPLPVESAHLGSSASHLLRAANREDEIAGRKPLAGKDGAESAIFKPPVETPPMPIDLRAPWASLRAAAAADADRSAGVSMSNGYRTFAVRPGCSAVRGSRRSARAFRQGEMISGRRPGRRANLIGVAHQGRYALRVGAA